MPKTSANSGHQDCKVFFVDDDRGVIHSSVQWLTLSGLKVKAFADPALLLKTIKPLEACIVVSDIRMPVLDGLSLMQSIHSRDKNIPVILITGHGDIPLAVEAMRLGAFEFLTKPFSPEGLLDVIKAAQQMRLQFLSKAKQEDEILQSAEEKQGVNADESESLSETGAAPLNALVEDYEKAVIESALKKHKGDIANVISELDLPRRTLNSKMKKYRINRRDFRK